MNTNYTIIKELQERILKLETENKELKNKVAINERPKNAIDTAVIFLEPLIWSARGQMKSKLQDVRKMLNYEPS